jgi:hypothetical protein
LESLLVTTNTYIDAAHLQEISSAVAGHMQSGSLKSFRLALKGRHWIMMTINVREGGADLGNELFHALFYTVDNLPERFGGEVEVPPDKWKTVRSVAIRELSEAERRAYDVELRRRP